MILFWSTTVHIYLARKLKNRHVGVLKMTNCYHRIQKRKSVNFPIGITNLEVKTGVCSIFT
jgi:hypothetical protein